MGTRKDKFLFLLIVFAGVFVYLFITLEVVQSGLKHQELKFKKNEALNRNRDLKFEYSDVMSSSNVEKYAKEELGLDYPKEKQFRTLKQDYEN
ncbi:MAG: cell division protein FtsL [Pseudomonadota bacterium]